MRTVQEIQSSLRRNGWGKSEMWRADVIWRGEHNGVGTGLKNCTVAAENRDGKIELIDFDEDGSYSLCNPRVRPQPGYATRIASKPFEWFGWEGRRTDESGQHWSQAGLFPAQLRTIAKLGDGRAVMHGGEAGGCTVDGARYESIVQAVVTLTPA